MQILHLLVFLAVLASQSGAPPESPHRMLGGERLYMLCKRPPCPTAH